MIIFIFVISPSTVLADEESRYQIGYAPGIFLYTAISDTGDSELITSISILKVSVNHRLDRKSRFTFSADYISEEGDASPSEVGQDIEGFISNIQYQRKFNFSRSLKFWVGGGLSAQNIKYTNRLFVDNDGFLDQTRPLGNRNDLDLSFVISVHKTKLFSENSELFFEFLLPIENGIRGFTIGIVYYPGFLNF